MGASWSRFERLRSGFVRPVLRSRTGACWGGSLGKAVPADPESAGLMGVPLMMTCCSLSSPPFPPSFPLVEVGFFSSVTFRPMTPRYQNMRFEMRTCSKRGRRALANLM